MMQFEATAAESGVCPSEVISRPVMRMISVTGELGHLTWTRTYPDAWKLTGLSVAKQNLQVNAPPDTSIQVI